MPNEELLTASELSSEIKVSTKTLSQWRWRGVGVGYVKLEGNVRYPRSLVEAWKVENTVEPRPAA
jgi:hypothetical protein